MTDISGKLKKNGEAVTKRLTEYMERFDVKADQGALSKAMSYSLISGGKAVRPFLAVEFSKLFGGDEDIALSFGCGVEMMHASSLIHDDLPAMDNDDMRRGKPSCHKAFGEYTAILAGDSLLLTALEILASEEIPAKLSQEAVRLLAKCGGPLGMMGGQQLDLEYESKEPVTVDMLTNMCRHKTGAIITGACLLGVLSAKEKLDKETYEKAYEAARQYGDFLGIAFQIYDDVLDVIGDEKTLGKPVGSDVEEGKTTFASLLGIDGATKLYKEYTDKAINSIASFEGADTLKDLAHFLISRNN